MVTRCKVNRKTPKAIPKKPRKPAKKIKENGKSGLEKEA